LNQDRGVIGLGGPGRDLDHLAHGGIRGDDSPKSCCPLDQVIVNAELHGFNRTIDQLEGDHHHDDAGRVRRTPSGVVYAAFSTRFIKTCESWLASNRIFPYPLLLTLAQAGLELL
jgi:hypothetical protein